MTLGNLSSLSLSFIIYSTEYYWYHLFAPPWVVTRSLSNDGHGKYFIECCSKISDVQQSCLSPALLYATLGTEKTHLQAIFRSVRCSCSESVVTWLEGSTNHLLRVPHAETLGQSFSSSWLMSLKGPKVNIFFLLFCCIYFLLPNYLPPASAIASEPSGIFIFHLLLPC